MKNWLKVLSVFLVMLLLYLYRILWFGYIKRVYDFLVGKVSTIGLILIVIAIILLLYRLIKKYRIRQLLHILLVCLYVVFGIFIYFNIDRVWDYLYYNVGMALTILGFLVIICLFVIFLIRVLPIDVDEI